MLFSIKLLIIFFAGKAGIQVREVKDLLEQCTVWLGPSKDNFVLYKTKLSNCFCKRSLCAYRKQVLNAFSSIRFCSTALLSEGIHQYYKQNSGSLHSILCSDGHYLWENVLGIVRVWEACFRTVARIAIMTSCKVKHSKLRKFQTSGCSGNPG